MQVEFPDSRTQALFNSGRELTRVFGSKNARLIRRRVDDLRAVPSLENARGLPGHLEELRGKRKGEFSMRLTGGHRLIFKPSGNPLPIKQDGGIDWAQIRAITILSAENYHD
ncbi:MAG: type II toxin-antitoxin system RelE/ParE family toxin [Betaproteobacteria bacterium]|nr:type II toxin-antitoxin system RelE/ParE family toxin [Betaproteobacteria bacterium]